MKRSLSWGLVLGATFFLNTVFYSAPARAEGDWEITPQSEQALQRGLDWLAKNQGSKGNWSSNHLGLVSMGALAFLSAGHLPERGPHGEAVHRALDYVVHNTKPSGLMNISEERHGMYNHGLATFVLGQAYGMSGDPRISEIMDRALKLIAQTQCADGGWDYHAESQARGHDLSLAVMQAKALRSAVDSGLEVPPEVIQMAIQSVRQHYTPDGCSRSASEEEQKKHPGRFTYNKGGGQATTAMAAAGVVCLQEFAQYDDWRIEKNMEVIGDAIREKTDPKKAKKSYAPFEAYTLYYVGQALYQVGGKHWKTHYPALRDSLVTGQIHSPDDPATDGMWRAEGSRVGGKPGDMYNTAAACFILALPNRYLPILQEGKIDSLRVQFQRN